MPRTLKTVAISQGHRKTLEHLTRHLKLQYNLKHQKDTEERDLRAILAQERPLPPNTSSLGHICYFVEN